MDQGFFYETVAPLMTIERTCFLAISTLTSEINFYTRLMRMRDKETGLPIFTCLQIQLACDKCKEEGKAADCIHLLHLVPRWQSGERHRRLKYVLHGEEQSSSLLDWSPSGKASTVLKRWLKFTTSPLYFFISHFVRASRYFLSCCIDEKLISSCALSSTTTFHTTGSALPNPTQVSI